MGRSPSVEAYFFLLPCARARWAIDSARRRAFRWAVLAGPPDLAVLPYFGNRFFGPTGMVGLRSARSRAAFSRAASRIWPARSHS